MRLFATFPTVRSRQWARGTGAKIKSGSVWSSKTHHSIPMYTLNDTKKFDKYCLPRMVSRRFLEMHIYWPLEACRRLWEPLCGEERVCEESIPSAADIDC